MSHFDSSAKQFSAGDGLVGFGAININVTMPGTTLEQTAPPSLLGPNAQTLSFLFWDTGRRITNKRTVRWSFNHIDQWTDWHATAWYGVSGDGGTFDPVIGTQAYWVGAAPLAPTPINGAASSFVNGPGGTPAWPWHGDDHALRTEWGPATIHAQATLASSGSTLGFANWIELVFGGDDSGFFAENDDAVSSTPSGSGVTGIVGTGLDYGAAQGQGSTLLAGYVTPPAPHYGDLLGRLREMLAGSLIGKFTDRGDPSPEDVIRLKLISESIDLVRGARPTSGDAFEGLIEAAKGMSIQELKRTIVSTQTTLRRGQAAVKYLESLAAKQRTAVTRAKKKPGR